jgi:hypothetical protein
LNSGFLIYICLLILHIGCAKSPEIDKLNKKVTKTNDIVKNEVLDFNEPLFDYKYHYATFSSKDFTVNIVINKNLEVLFAKHYNQDHIFDRFKTLYTNSLSVDEYYQFIDDFIKLDLPQGAQGVDFGLFDIGSHYYEITVFRNPTYNKDYELSSIFQVYQAKKLTRLNKLLYKLLKKKKWKKHEAPQIKLYKIDLKKKLMEQFETNNDAGLLED